MEIILQAIFRSLHPEIKAKGVGCENNQEEIVGNDSSSHADGMQQKDCFLNDRTDRHLHITAHVTTVCSSFHVIGRYYFGDGILENKTTINPSERSAYKLD